MYNGYIGIEKRGSSSQYFYEKKQYGVETWDMNGADIDVSLGGLPKEEDWIFYAPYGDKSLIRNNLIYSLSNNMGQYASRSKFMEVNINGDYKGVYSLFEKIKVDKHRVNISKTQSRKGDETGYILKIDKLLEKLLIATMIIMIKCHFYLIMIRTVIIKITKLVLKYILYIIIQNQKRFRSIKKSFIQNLINQFEDVLISR